MLRRQGFFPPMGDVQYPNLWLQSPWPALGVGGRCRDEAWDLQRLDRTRGRVFTYDSNGNLLLSSADVESNTAQPRTL